MKWIVRVLTKITRIRLYITLRCFLWNYKKALNIMKYDNQIKEIFIIKAGNNNNRFLDLLKSLEDKTFFNCCLIMKDGSRKNGKGICGEDNINFFEIL